MSDLLRRFPVTALLVAQFVPFAVLPAYIQENPRAHFVAALVGVAALSSFSLEFPMSFVHRGAAQFDAELRRKVPDGFGSSARRVALVAVVVAALAAYFGLGSYRVSIGAAPLSPLTSYLTPLRAWTVIAAAFLLAAWKAGQLERGSTRRWLALLVGVELATAIWNAVLAPAAAIAFTVASMAVLTRFIRLRTLAAATVVGIVAWPLLVGFRNVVRAGQGGDASYLARHDAFGRLRMDLLVSSAAQFDPPIDLGQPGFGEVLRYGLVPRILEPGRPSLQTGRLLNEAVGGGDSSAYTFMLVGNIWAFTGPVGLIAYCAVVGVLAAVLLMRSTGPLQLAALGLLVHFLVWMGASFPESTIGFLQSLMSLAAAFLYAMVWPAHRSRYRIVASSGIRSRRGSRSVA